ncbi:MAG: TCR/Tet family MFS transporter [Cyanobacteria bacterium CRU_2_1]|nr:TCR/Tet family MFS transporter [Cyanobacteria bacterium RU_5_0]NJR61709.1 TCR/Tet family MFS transporter [Cyanobacteria bacterium CRU_2_1]
MLNTTINEETPKRTPHPLRPFTLFIGSISYLGIGVLNPIMPALIEGRYGGTAFHVGLMYTTLATAQFIGSPVIGLLSDRYGRRLILMFSLLGAAIAYLIMGIGGALWVMFAGWAIFGITDGTASSIFAYIADTATLKARTRAFAFMSAATGVGFTIGPMISARFASIDLALPLYIVAATSVVGLVWAYWAMPETFPNNPRVARVSFRQLNPLSQLFVDWRNPHLRWLMLSFLLTTMTSIITSSNLAAMANDLFGWQPQQIAPIFMLLGVVEVLSQVLIMPVLLNFLREIQITSLGAISLSIAFVLFGLFSLTGLPALVYMAAIMANMGTALLEVSLQGLMSKTVAPEAQGRIQGSYRATFALGRIIGPLWAGWLYQQINPAMPYWIGAGQMMLVLILTRFAAFKLQHRGIAQ